MAASSHNSFPRSPNPSNRSYDSSSVSSATSPRPQVQLLGNLMGTNARQNNNQAPHPIGIPPLPPVSQTGFQPYTPVTATSVMGRDSLPPTDSVASTPGLSSAQLSANVSAQKRAYRQRRKDPRYVLNRDYYVGACSGSVAKNPTYTRFSCDILFLFTWRET